ncbi:putative membrane protein, conserved [Thermococcus sp. 2319x1]|uniref:hypothetical protein n=1 Tax=Thermococcus sp. 2319x1 TaxID=1674923 RepID=UPI00073A6B32|nr:hypothetical protein [Thermococcus sp. 2319x1]ALV63779.1 putative membrane protein, conserved [Thermococcus sp. 2319x1]
MRIKFSPIPLVILFFIFLSYRQLLPVLLLAPLAFVSYFFGTLFLMAVIGFLVYYKIGGALGVLIVALALIFIESAYLDREKAPREHYLILSIASLLAIPTYALIMGLSLVMPKLEVTAVAVFILITLYVFSRIVTSD